MNPYSPYQQSRGLDDPNEEEWNWSHWLQPGMQKKSSQRAWRHHILDKTICMYQTIFRLGWGSLEDRNFALSREIYYIHM